MTWEQRWHPLREEWVVVAAHRQQRPWIGDTVQTDERRLPTHDESCFFCPRNTRVNGSINPDYSGVHVFENDLPCVGPDAPVPADAPGIYESRPASGIARVVCYTPRHDATLATLESSVHEELIRCWQEEYVELGGQPDINHVLMFENKGGVVGVSNPHPHGQIYATNFVFKTIETEVNASRAYHDNKGSYLFEDILQTEQQDGRRVLCENDSAIAFIPYFARYAYECYIAPKAKHAAINGLSADEVRDLAAVLKETLVRLDNLWKMSFPYVLALHQAPTDGGDYDSFHFHIEIHPPLRKPSLLKYLAGPEIGGGNFLSDTCPEEKAAELQTVGSTHYADS